MLASLRLATAPPGGLRGQLPRLLLGFDRPHKSFSLLLASTVESGLLLGYFEASNRRSNRLLLGCSLVGGAVASFAAFVAAQALPAPTGATRQVFARPMPALMNQPGMPTKTGLYYAR